MRRFSAMMPNAASTPAGSAYSTKATPSRPSIHAAESSAVPISTPGGAMIGPRAHQMNRITAKAAIEASAPSTPITPPA
ncbi:hypothetical protein ACFSLT_22600 [Novosphingobium resinovorum]